MKPTVTVKRIIIEILDYLKYQVENDKCTLDELRSIHDSLCENLDVDCTTEDLSMIYNQSQSNVRNMLTRNFMPKPKRKVYYNFAKFIKFIPKNWRRSSVATPNSVKTQATSA